MSPVQKGHPQDSIYTHVKACVCTHTHLQYLHYFLENCHHRKVLMASYSRMKGHRFHKVLIQHSCKNGSLSVAFFGPHSLDISVELSGRFGLKGTEIIEQVSLRAVCVSGTVLSTKNTVNQKIPSLPCPHLSPRRQKINKQISIQ